MWQDDKIQDDRQFDQYSFFITIDSKGNMLMNANYNEGKEKLIKTDDYCSYVRTGGYDDWYVPTVEQLVGLFKVRHQLKYVHLSTYTDSYWSSETGAFNGHSFTRKIVNFDDRRTRERIGRNSSDSHIRCVRDMK